MQTIRAIIRLLGGGVLLLGASTAVLLAALLPFSIRGYRPSFLILSYFVGRLLRLWNVQIVCPEQAQLANFAGFIFPNHVSYLDVMVVVALTPVRFLAKAEVRRMPLIGWIARAIGCVFVDRTDKASRQAARQSLARLNHFPPIALYPEGKRGPGDALLPFRYGAFELVTDVGAPLLPCIISYNRLDVAIWHRGESILRALWRLASFAGPLVVTVTLLTPIVPAPGADSVQLSQTTHSLMTAVWQQQQAPPTTTLAE